MQEATAVTPGGAFEAAEWAATTLDTPAPTVDLGPLPRSTRRPTRPRRGPRSRDRPAPVPWAQGGVPVVADDIGARRSQSLGHPRAIGRQTDMPDALGPRRLRAGR